LSPADCQLLLLLHCCHHCCPAATAHCQQHSVYPHHQTGSTCGLLLLPLLLHLLLLRPLLPVLLLAVLQCLAG
jgi:hypothetical protein